MDFLPVLAPIVGKVIGILCQSYSVVLQFLKAEIVYISYTDNPIQQREFWPEAWNIARV